MVRFEHASINLELFIRRHPFETSRFLLDCITKHYREVRISDMWEKGRNGRNKLNIASYNVTSSFYVSVLLKTVLVIRRGVLD